VGAQGRGRVVATGRERGVGEKGAGGMGGGIGEGLGTRMGGRGMGRWRRAKGREGGYDGAGGE